MRNARSGQVVPAREMVRPDGAVVVPAELVGPVLGALVRDLTARVRSSGAPVSPGVQELLYALHEGQQRAENPLPPNGFANEPAGHQVDRVDLVTVADAAHRLGRSEQWVRTLLRRGQLTGRRAGRAWLVDPTSYPT